MEQEPLIDREEVTAMIFMLADINAGTARIRFLRDEYLDGEEEISEDDA